MLHITRVAICFRAKKALTKDYANFYVGMPVVQTVGRSVGVRSGDGQILLGWVVCHLFLPMVFRCKFSSRARALQIVVFERE